MKNVINILVDAVSSFISHSSDFTPSEWLHDYLTENLDQKSPEDIKTISDEIIETIQDLEVTQASMEKALDSGQSAENWFASELMKDNQTNGEKAFEAAMLYQGFIEAENSLNEENDINIEDITEDKSEFQDSDWNDFKLKDTLKNVALEAGRVCIKEMASDVFTKASEDGISQVINDKDYVIDILAEGACKGLKVAVAAGLTIAAEKGIIPKASVDILTTLAHKTVETGKVFTEVIKGKATITEALVKIKNTAISTVASIWNQHKNDIKENVINGIGYVFGINGVIVSGAVNGLMNREKGESRLKSALKGIGNAAVNFLKQEIKLPFFKTVKRALFNS